MVSPRGSWRHACVDDKPKTLTVMLQQCPYCGDLAPEPRRKEAGDAEEPTS